MALKKIKRARPDPVPPAMVFSTADELVASPFVPLPPEAIVWRVNQARESVAMLRDSRGGRDEWLALATINNLFCVMRDRGEVADPDGLIEECERALQASADRCLERPGSPLGVDYVGFFHLRSMVEDFEECLWNAPARTMVRAMRITEKRQRAAHRNLK